MTISHNRKLNRLKKFDYARPGYYFITICTQGRYPYFGHIKNDVMCVNKFGSIVYRRWEWLCAQYPYIRPHAFVVMQNHVHGVLEICDASSVGADMVGLDNASDESKTSVGTGRDGLNKTSNYIKTSVGTGRDLSLHAHCIDTSIHDIPRISHHDVSARGIVKIKPLSELIGAFKTTSSKMIHEHGCPAFRWQRSFHDHIIRDERAYQNICRYIINNPQAWWRDRNNWLRE